MENDELRKEALKLANELLWACSCECETYAKDVADVILAFHEKHQKSPCNCLCHTQRFAGDITKHKCC